MKNPRTHFLHGLLAAFGTGMVTGDVDAGTGKTRCKRGPDPETLRKKRKAQRQARKKGRKR